MSQFKTAVLNANDIIDQRGWFQNGDESNTGAVCMMYAVAIAVHKLIDEEDEADQLYYQIDEALTKQLHIHPIYYNDTVGRTQWQVQAALKECANKYE